MSLAVRSSWFQNIASRWPWIINLGLLGVLLGWTLLDPHFEATVVRLGHEAQRWGGSGGELLNDAICQVVGRPLDVYDWDAIGRRVVLLLTVLIGASLNGLVLLAGLFRGSNRGLRFWLAFLTLAAVWMAVASQWSTLTWRGKQLRMRHDLRHLELLAAPLRANWPSEDDQIPDLGAFMAYPIGRPSTLILLEPPELPDTHSAIGLVHRDSGGALRFQLTGRERGDWMEWHPAGSKPSTFVDGLAEWHRLQRAVPVGHGWYLVRYGV